MDLSTFSYSHIYWIFLLPLIGAGANMDHHLRAKNYITINYNTGAIITSD